MTMDWHAGIERKLLTLLARIQCLERIAVRKEGVATGQTFEEEVKDFENLTGRVAQDRGEGK